jgi:bifunctional enzyme CysN/CysC
MTAHREQMNIVVVGHVDHGKSTVIGRLLADTGSLPQGKLEQVKALCERNARPFEYAFLLDALKDEQAQGITIDTARCFFNTEKRDYIIIDAPGHVEFLKNMVSGAARAEAALLVIDAHEGIAENSKRHGYLVSMLGIRQVIVLVNKMDLIGFDQSMYDAIVSEYRSFLGKLGLTQIAFVPLSAREGENLVRASDALPWYQGGSVLQIVEGLTKQADEAQKPFRFPVQDIYKFTESGDERRIVAGTVESGRICVGDEVVFFPSGKRSIIRSIEEFNAPSRASVSCGQATGFTLRDELYLKRGEIMCKRTEPQPYVSERFRANVFWMGNAPLIKGKKYKLKIGTSKILVRLVEVISSIDATELSSIAGKQQVDRHDVAECVFETLKPIAFDTVGHIAATSRFVLVDNYDIAGGGIIIQIDDKGDTWLHQHVRTREVAWDRGIVTVRERVERNGHRGKTIVIYGDNRQRSLAKELEKSLFSAGYQSYYSSVENLRIGLEADSGDPQELETNQLSRLGELARILTDAGLIFITALDEVDADDLSALRELNKPYEVLVVRVGSAGEPNSPADLSFEPADSIDRCLSGIIDALRAEKVIPEYSI